MSLIERDIFGAIIRSSLVLSMIIAFPAGGLASLLGPGVGLVVLAAAIPISAQLGGAVPLGENLADVTHQIRSSFERIARSAGLSALLGINVMILTPAAIRDIPFLSLLIMSHFSISFYILGIHSKPERVGPDLVVPIVVISIISMLSL